MQQPTHGFTPSSTWSGQLDQGLDDVRTQGELEHLLPVLGIDCHYSISLSDEMDECLDQSLRGLAAGRRIAGQRGDHRGLLVEGPTQTGNQSGRRTAAGRILA